MVSTLLSFFFGYLIGSIPTGFLLLKRSSGIDIRKAGTGNVGAMNAYDISGSKKLGILIMAIDVLKGIAAVIGCRVLISPDIMCVSIAGIASIIGHNYPVWLKGKGGRGLSTAAGVMLVLGWYFVGIWCLVWGICYGVSKNIHLANLIALVLSPVVIFCTPSQFYHLGFPAYTGSNQIFIVVTSITLIVLIRHAGPIAELWKSNHA